MHSRRDCGKIAFEIPILLTRATVARLQADDICLVGGAEFHGRYVLRVSVIAAPLTESDIDRLAVAIMNAWRGLAMDAAAQNLKMIPRGPAMRESCAYRAVVSNISGRVVMRPARGG